FLMPWYIESIYGLFYLLMVLVAAGGNFIVIWIVVGHKRMRTVTNYFLVNLAISDALITIFNTMFNFIYMARSHWPFGSYYCKFTHFIVPCTISSSVFTFIAIAFDRYFIILHPMKPRLSARTVLAVIFGIWLASFAIAFPNLIYAQIFPFRCENDRTVCYLHWDDDDLINDDTDFRYNMVLFVVTYILPLLILCLTYMRVAVELWSGQPVGEWTEKLADSMRMKKRVVKMMVAVVCIFGLCWLPQNVFLIINAKRKQMDRKPHEIHIYLIIYWIAMSNSMYNPIIYCWMNAKFRNGFQRALRWLPCV
ncbi:hypothetical protein HELRODRAFT_121592, partial [Helobdella robusta]|uniref:G-protein coupled receptors family 1 profile domain-containing protein n=1 Tax=Helobdella robusta TaxID=6412 RepID=T1EGS5_HELRO